MPTSKFLNASILGKIVTFAHSVLLLIMPRKKRESAPTPQWSNILIPLYVYPSPGAWDPLYAAIEAYPNLNFTIIVNPGNGPGNGVLPDANYLREIPRLNSNPNVRIIGYISTCWTKRKLALVLADINTYAGWYVSSPGLGISGIFLDETPTIYRESSMQFLRCLASTIRSESNFGKDPLIIHNPGSVPDIRYISFCDVSVVFEESFATYQERGVLDAIVNFEVGRQAIGCIIHHIPPALTLSETKSLTQDLRYVASHLAWPISHFTSTVVILQVTFSSPATPLTTIPASVKPGPPLLQTWEQRDTWENT